MAPPADFRAASIARLPSPLLSTKRPKNPLPMTPSHGRFARFILTLAALLALPACGGSSRTVSTGPAPEPAGAEQIGDAPDVEPTGPTVTSGLLGTARYDLPLEANPWVEAELQFLTGQRRAVIARWLQRGDRYGPWVQDVFATYGVPRDLHHLAMVESGYQPTARSRVGALGIWQFMPATGREMGLRIDALVDERMDPVRSTHAAARHLRDLHRRFHGDWALAAAAYNAGTGRISRALGRFGVSTYWDLLQVGDLASETKHYVPRLYAVTIIGRDPARFGYPLSGGPVRRFAYDSVRVDVETPLAELARIGQISLDELRSLNPHLKTGISPAGYWVWVPAEMGQATQLAFLASEFRRDGGHGRYAVRHGDDVGKLAALTGLSVERIRELNPGVDPAALRSGQRLVLPSAAARILSDRPVERVAAREEPAARENRPTSTSRSSRNGSAAPSEERTAERPRGNGSESASRSSAPAERTADAQRSSSGGRTGRGDDSGKASDSTSSRSPSRERTGGRSGATREHVVDTGETLWSIARRYDVSVDAVKTANEMDGETIRSGQKLRIPGAAPGTASEPRSETRTASTERRRTGDAPGEKKSESPAARTAARFEEHVVKNGETLWSISRRYRTTVDSIVNANAMREGQAIQPGQKLRIPAQSSSR